MRMARKKKPKKPQKIQFGGKNVKVRSLIIFAMFYATLYIILVGLAIYYFNGVLYIGDFPILLIDWLDAFFGIVFPVIFLGFFFITQRNGKK